MSRPWEEETQRCCSPPGWCIFIFLHPVLISEAVPPLPASAPPTQQREEMPHKSHRCGESPHLKARVEDASRRASSQEAGLSESPVNHPSHRNSCSSCRIYQRCNPPSLSLSPGTLVLLRPAKTKGREGETSTQQRTLGRDVEPGLRAQVWKGGRGWEREGRLCQNPQVCSCPISTHDIGVLCPQSECGLDRISSSASRSHLLRLEFQVCETAGSTKHCGCASRCFFLFSQLADSSRVLTFHDCCLQGKSCCLLSPPRTQFFQIFLRSKSLL